jgi:hypothetical protein
MSISRVLIAAALVGAAFATAPAFADDGLAGTFLSGTCNGQADSDCTYCSYEGGNLGHPISLCMNGASGYYWETCGLWSANQCVVG